MREFKKYKDDDMLMLSGIQHIAFCERQWALIHLEKQWKENVLTVEGKFLHEKADNPYIVEKRKDVIVSRAMPISSSVLGLYGIADIVEFHKSENGVKIEGRKGSWLIKPIEYKRGRPKNIYCDKIQLCAQAICLEQMYQTKIFTGDIFYDAIKRREEVEFNEELRNMVFLYAQKMHMLFSEGKTPHANWTPSCKNCSLEEICMPEISKYNPKDYLLRSLKCESF